jgi:sarcosine oxidase subunit gamma
VFTAKIEHDLGIAKLQLLGRKQADDLLVQLVGGPAPDVGRQRESDGLTIAWLAPGEWLLLGREPIVASHARALALTGGNDALVVDLTHARTAFLLSGTAVRAVLAAHCPLDLWPDSFPENAAARSLLGDAGMFISRLTDGRDGRPTFRIILDQTMAPYAARMLGGDSYRAGADT